MRQKIVFSLAPSSRAARQPPRVWHVVENLSSFERVARSCAADEGALWLPGYPPSWWQQAVTTLLRHLPAPARIACDPDPDGIAIALQAGGLWSAAGLPWQPWRMGPAELLGLPIHRPLDERDRQLLASLGVRIVVDGHAAYFAAIKATYDCLREQRGASTELARNVEAIAQMSEENSAAVASVASTAHNLVSVSDTLRASVSSFRV